MDQPCEVSLETYALCNAACTFCPYPTIERKGERMSDALIDRLVGEMAAFEVSFVFSPFKLNEPLLDSRLIPLCKRITAETVASLRIFTNGSALTRKKCDELAELERVHHLWVSLNSTDAEEYRALMGLDFEQTARKLDALHEREFPHPVVLSRVGASQTFVLDCRERWPKFQPFLIKNDSWLGFTEAYTDVVPDSPCTRWFDLSIMADGRVSHCCMHDGTDTRYNVGDLNEQTLLDVYNDPFLRRRRQALMSRKSLGDEYPCSACTY